MSKQKSQRAFELIGREEEIVALKKAFGEAKCGLSQFVLIEGEPGVGKSTLVESMRSYFSGRNGIFIGGKFDVHHRDVPYNAIASGLGIYLESEVLSDAEKTAELRARLEKALGTNSGLISRLVPAVGRVLSQGEVTTDIENVDERRDRLNNALLNFIYAFTSADHPLVVFMDDFQWADSASRQLISTLLTVEQANGLLIIATLRNTEISELHPVTRLLGDLDRAKTSYERIQLKNLTFDDIKSLVVDRLGTSCVFIDDLTELIYSKTHGNPFFVDQFYLCLLETGALKLDGLDWIYDPTVAANLDVTENVLEFVTKRIAELNPVTRSVMALAACFGARFNLSDLTAVSGWLQAGIEEALDDALELGLITIRAKGYYAFSHDRFHEAISRLTEAEERSLNHYRIGSMVLKDTQEADLYKMAFFLARQFKEGHKHVRKNEEKLLVAKVNLLAARRAKESFAYDSVAQHVETALEILPDINWATYGDLLYSLYLIKAEASAYSGDAATADVVFDLILRNVSSVEKKAEVYKLAVGVKISFGHYQEAVDLGMRGLQALGVDFKVNPSRFEVLVKFLKVRRKIKQLGLARLESLPLGNPHSSDSLAMMLAANAYFYNDRHVTMLTLSSCERLLNEGVTAGSWSALSVYAAILAGRAGMYTEAIAIGEIAFKKSQSGTLVSEKALVAFMVPAFLRVWMRPLREINAVLDENFDFARENGATAAAMSSALIAGSYSVFTGESLDMLDSRIHGYLKYMGSHNSQSLHDSLLSSLLAISCLRAETLQPGSFSTSELSEEGFVERLRANQSSNPMAWYGLQRLWVDYTLGDYEKALTSLELSRAFLDAVPFAYCTMVHHAYATLLLAAIYKKAGWLKLQYRWQMKKGLRQLRKLATISSGDFLVMYQLATAEYDRVCGRHEEAADDYVEAIVAARKYNLVHLEALGEELVGRFKSEELGVHDEARVHFERAYILYRKWGARAKLELLKEYAPTSADGSSSPSNGEIEIDNVA